MPLNEDFLHLDLKRECVLDKAFVPYKVNYHTNLDFKLPSRVATSQMHMRLLAHIPFCFSLETEIMAVLWVWLLFKPCSAVQSHHTKGNQSHWLLLHAIHYFICLKQPVLDKMQHCKYKMSKVAFIWTCCVSLHL